MKGKIKYIQCVVCGRNIAIAKENHNDGICSDCIESGYFWCEREHKLCHFTHEGECRNDKMFNCSNTRDTE